MIYATPCFAITFATLIYFDPFLRPEANALVCVSVIHESCAIIYRPNNSLEEINSRAFVHDSLKLSQYLLETSARDHSLHLRCTSHVWRDYYVSYPSLLGTGVFWAGPLNVVQPTDGFQLLDMTRHGRGNDKWDVLKFYTWSRVSVRQES